MVTCNNIIIRITNYPNKVSITKTTKMKTLNLTNIDEILNEYALSVEEMICVKGGEAGDPILKPSIPPVKI
jgi:hypothetical protein